MDFEKIYVWTNVLRLATNIRYRWRIWIVKGWGRSLDLDRLVDVILCRFVLGIILYNERLKQYSIFWKVSRIEWEVGKERVMTNMTHWEMANNHCCRRESIHTPQKKKKCKSRQYLAYLIAEENKFCRYFLQSVMKCWILMLLNCHLNVFQNFYWIDSWRGTWKPGKCSMKHQSWNFDSWIMLPDQKWSKMFPMRYFRLC